LNYSIFSPSKQRPNNDFKPKKLKIKNQILYATYCPSEYIVLCSCMKGTNTHEKRLGGGGEREKLISKGKTNIEDLPDYLRLRIPVEISKLITDITWWTPYNLKA
jgi:hypothetical protein